MSALPRFVPKADIGTVFGYWRVGVLKFVEHRRASKRPHPMSALLPKADIEAWPLDVIIGERLQK